jgi:hypothetical protein
MGVIGATQGTLRYDPISTNGPESIAAFPRENTRIGAADMPCHGPTSWIYSPRDFPKWASRNAANGDVYKCKRAQKTIRLESN